MVKAPTGASQKPRISLRVGVVQFCPKIGQVQVNITRARELCRGLKPRSVELLCFPEMAFTGYVFDSAQAISPYLEQPQTGPTSEFCQELAKQLSCYVIAGYPERLEPQEASVHLEDVLVNPLAGAMEIEPDILGRSTSPSLEHERTHVGANSAVLYGPSGECVLAYRKTNLFETDITWAKPGTGFVTVTLPLPARRPSTSSTPVHFKQTTVNLTLGICMDLNPQPPADWTSAEGPYELADHCIENNTDILILLNSWLDSGIPDDGDRVTEGDEEEVVEGEGEETTGPDWHTLNYWAARLWPLWRKDVHQRVGVADGADGEGDGDRNEEGEEEEKSEHETTVVVCNRTGEENGKTFAGTSAMFRMRTGCGRARLLHKMGRREEGVQVWELPF